MIFFFSACAQNHTKDLKEVNKLIENGQYLTAYDILAELDSAHKDVEITLKKTALVLKFHANTIMHEMFELVNLKKSEKLKDYKKDQGDFKMKEFPVREILDTLLWNNPERHDIHNNLAEFYYIIYKEYPNGWRIKSSEVLKKMEEHAQKALNKKVATPLSLFILGYFNAERGNHDQAINNYASALHADPNYAQAHYNLALSMLYLKNPLAALPSAQNAFELFADSFNISEAARLTGFVLEELSDDKEALTYFKKAWQFYPANLENIHALTDVMVRLNHKEYKQYTEIYYNAMPEDAAVYGGLIEIYSQYGKTQELVPFFEDKLSHKPKNIQTQANLNYFLAGLVHTSDPEKAINYLKTARKHFSSFLPSKHGIIQGIDEKLEELKAK